MTEPATPTDSARATRTAYAFGGLLIAAGGTFCAMAIGWIRFDTSGWHAPREILFYIGLLFALCGIAFAGAGRLPPWFNKLLMAMVLTCFALIPAWIAFGSGPRTLGGNG